MVGPGMHSAWHDLRDGFNVRVIAVHRLVVGPVRVEARVDLTSSGLSCEEAGAGFGGLLHRGFRAGIGGLGSGGSRSARTSTRSMLTSRLVSASSSHT